MIILLVNKHSGTDCGFLWGKMEGRVDGGRELACSTYTNTCTSHCLRQPHADKVLDCTLVQVNRNRLPSSALQPPTVKWKDQLTVEIQGGILVKGWDGEVHSRWASYLRLPDGRRHAATSLVRLFFSIWSCLLGVQYVDRAVSILKPMVWRCWCWST